MSYDQEGTAPQALPDASDFAGQLELAGEDGCSITAGARRSTLSPHSVCTKIGKSYVDFPFFMSIDNATVHPHWAQPPDEAA
jgi:hypothetical protein